MTSNVRKICGVLGAINLTSGHHLVIATHRLPVGYINNQVIWRLAGIDIIPFIPSLLHLNENQKNENETYLSMVRATLDMPYLYFSYSYDITHTLQRLHSMSPDLLGMSLLERADSRFVWNGNLLKPFQKPELRRYCLPLLMGCKSRTHQVVVFSLISSLFSHLHQPSVHQRPLLLVDPHFPTFHKTRWHSTLLPWNRQPRKCLEFCRNRADYRIQRRESFVRADPRKYSNLLVSNAKLEA